MGSPRSFSIISDFKDKAKLDKNKIEFSPWPQYEHKWLLKNNFKRGVKS